jgi:molecular chaperone DnaK
MIFQTETQLKELGEKLSDENKVAVEYALTELRMDQLKTFSAVQTALIISMLLGKLLLKQCMLKENKVKMKQPEGEAQGDDVQDVDYEEVKVSR